MVSVRLLLRFMVRNHLEHGTAGSRARGLTVSQHGKELYNVWLVIALPAIARTNVVSPVNRVSYGD